MEMELESIMLPGIDPQRPIVIAGPCSAETEEQVMETARGIADKGIKLFRAGIWKPRTKPGGFEGIGAEGLQWLKRVKKETGMYVATEVATKDHVFEALKAGIDVLWIGARTTVNPFAVQEIADALKGVDVPVLIKNPVNPDLELWIGAFQRLYGAGIRRLGAIHRGFSSYDKKMYRNLPLWHIPIELRRRMPNLPIFCDPSHIGGKRELIAPLCQQAMDLSFDGLIIESHCNPDCAWSDASQQITPDVLSATPTRQRKTWLNSAARSMVSTNNYWNCWLNVCVSPARSACTKKSTICQSCNHRATAKFWKSVPIWVNRWI